MPKVKFVPLEVEIEVAEGTKVLVAGTRAKVPIRYGCASCRCGTCAVRITPNSGELSQMGSDEQALLERMKLSLDGSVRLACRTKVVSGCITVDLDFQNTYSPDQGDEIE